MESENISSILKEAEKLAQAVAAPFQPIAFKCAVELLQGHSLAPLAKEQAAASAKKPAKSSKAAEGPKARIEMLIESDFFSQKRALNEVIDALAEKGYTYAQQDISTPMIRLCKSRQLRRIREDGKWKYVNS